MLSMKNESFLTNENGNKLWRHRHDEIMDIFESNTRFFRKDQNESASMIDAINWFFNCSNLCPLFVHENYLKVASSHKKYKPGTSENDLFALVEATELISDGDVIDSTIQQTQTFNMIPANALISCLFPSRIICLQFWTIRYRIQFPQFCECVVVFGMK